MPVWCFLAGTLPEGKAATSEEVLLIPFLSAHAQSRAAGSDCLDFGSSCSLGFICVGWSVVVDG